jgi:restriction system protein
MTRRNRANGGTAKWVVWIAVFMSLAAPYWPQTAGVAYMGLALFGLLHLAILVFDEIARPQFDPAMTPEQYEHFCADLLREIRWTARVTQASGDQGVDIVAEKRGARIVVQCKKYSKPVGNRAVQEIVAAIAHEDAGRGVVVATNGYTRAARRLAASNRVLLLHHSQLRRIDRLLRE